MKYHLEKHKLANWWETHETGKILCTLCPRYCTIGNGQAGFCYIRQNIEGKLYSIGYGRPTGFAIDPIEKKPLNHFLPGSSILSFGTAGCNLGCKFCQNWSISKAKLNSVHSNYASPEDVIALAVKYKTPSIAFTYNDPVIFGEYVVDVSKLAGEEKINSVMVTAGYIDNEARKEVFKYITAANVDLKSFSEMFYHKLTFSHLAPVLDTLAWLKNETDIWLEITTLLIPEENDSEEEIKQMCGWLLQNLGDDVPVHFTAFHPDFKLRNIPSTPISTLVNARNIALSSGIKFCYVGNVHHLESQSTYCPKCKALLIQRNWHSIETFELSGNMCRNCCAKIPGKFF
ncbi:MAG: pyruvate-formate lyase-activating enzyme [Ignavibacteria bacterium]|nr:MAG: pyruvate-formate lyase-activating enzyme [Ignavibacteria bacterium]KAF0161574.1 MAG: pyruvate-formate lyase-activating enzyme [Ignavibacteria bacterium]